METTITLTNVGLITLAREINTDNCEVAITRFFVPEKYYNVNESKITFKHGDETITEVFPAGYYPDLESIVHAFEYLITKDETIVVFDNDEESQKFTISVANPRTSITLSKNLALLLNLPIRIRGTVTSLAPVKLMNR
ncbi:MAG: hypothetical protein AAF304_10340 [Pseudomonadota bacterium]